MKKKPKIPPLLRVTLKEQSTFTYHEDGTHTKTLITPLGFANVYDTHTSTYKKREYTQDYWAYGGGHWHDYEKPSYFLIGNSMWIRRRSYEETPNGRVEKYEETQVPDELQPRIISNTPQEGFRIQRSVSRRETSNKLWRILDPRGFELEISTGAMEDVIMGGEIKEGLIIGACVWRTGKILERA